MDDFAADNREEALAKVKLPAIGLIAAGVIGVLFGVLGLVSPSAGSGFLEPLAGKIDEAAEQAATEEEAEKLREQADQIRNSGAGGGGNAVMSILGILLSGLVLFGGLKLMKLESKGLAIAASVIAIIPCFGCCCVGIPVGIWALVVINSATVKDAFV